MLAKTPWCLIVLAVMLLRPAAVQAQEDTSDLTQLSLEELMGINVIPVNAASSHIHSKNEWMIGYRCQATSMTSSQKGSMDMQMHMASVMYGVTNRLTLVAMLPYRHMSMEMPAGSASSMVMSGHGAGDLKLETHYALLRSSSHYLILNTGVSLPTGSIDLRAAMPSRPKLPYSMQPGSGTWSLRPGTSFIHQHDSWTIGLHADAVFRIGRNDDDYRLGHAYHAGGWLSWSVREWIAPLVHVDGHGEGAVQAAASQQDTRVRLADPSRQASRHVSVSPGVALYIPSGPLEGQRLTAQMPVLHYEYSERPFDHALQLRIGWHWTL